MPLKPGNKEKSISDNVSELIRAGHAPGQAVAIALSNAAKASPKAYADGGDVHSSDSDKDDEAAKRKKLLGQIINFPGVDPTPVPTPKAYADGGDVVLPDVPPMSTSVSEALPPDQLQKLLAVRDELPQQPGGPLLPDWAADAAAKERLPVPTQSEAGFRMIGEPTGGSVATVPEETGLVRRAAMPEVIDTTGSTVGEEAAPSLLGAAGELASKAALPLTAAYEFLKSTPAGTGEDDLMRDRQAKAAAAAGGKPGDANGPSLFDMVSDKYKELTPQMTAPAPAAPARGTSGQVADSSPVSAPAPTSTTPAMNPLLAKYLQDRVDMKGAVEKANTNRLIAGISGAAGQLAASTYGATKPVDEAGFKALEDNANAPVTALQTVQGAGMKGIQEQQALMTAEQAQEAGDPNSALSKRTQLIYGPILSKLGMPPQNLAGMSATDIKSELQQPMDAAAKMKQAEAQQAANREMALARIAAAGGAKQTQHYTQAAQQLEQMRGNPAVQQAERDMYAASKANRLISQAPGGDLNNLSRGQVALLVSDVSKIAQGGQPNEADLNALTPNTLQTKMAGVTSALMNDPSPMNAGAFLKQYQQYANGITQDAQKVISDRYGRIINTYAPMLTPDEKRTLEDNYVNRFKDVAPSASAPGSGKVKVSNGSQTFMIDQADLPHAQADGFKQVQ